jgi:hypothetical protein
MAAMAVLRFVALAAVVALASGCAGREVRGPFNNQYIDAETGKPIEGAVFLVVWNRLTPNLVDGGGRRFYDAREAVSGPDGRVEIPASVIWRPGLEVEFHELAPKGFALERIEVTPPSGRRHIEPTRTLMRVMNREERCERLSYALPSVPATAIPKFQDATDRERTELRCSELRGIQR